MDVCILGSFDLSFDFSFDVGQSCTVCVIIVDKYGNPVEGADLTSICNNKVTDTGTTDSNGKAILNIRPSKYNQIVVSIAGFQTTTITISPPINGECTDYTIDYCIESEESNVDSGIFFKFNTVNFCQPLVNTCTEFCFDPDCISDEEQYRIPSIIGDEFSFIVNTEDIGLDSDYQLNDGLKLGIYKGGLFVQYAGSIAQPGYPDSNQLVCTLTIPNIDFGNYQLGFSLDSGIIGVSLIINNESAQEVCDGSLQVIPNVVGEYMYSIDGGNTYSQYGVFENLCKGIYALVVIGVDCGEYREIIEIGKNVDCSIFAGSETNDLLPYNTNDFLNCYTNDFL